VRLFFAIPLPERVQVELARFQSAARASGVEGSWPDPGGLHLTLAFLGEQDAALIPELLSTAARIAAGHAAFPLRMERLGGFPKDGSARVLWLGLADQPALGALAEALRNALRRAAVPFDEKPFRAHVTLARFRKPRDVRRLEPVGEGLVFEVRDLVLFQSLQTPAGQRYVALGRGSLRT